VTLDVVHRQAGSDPVQVAFREALMNLRTYSATLDDHRLLQTRTWNVLPQAERNEFNLAVHLLPKRSLVAEHNKERLAALDQRVLICPAEHAGPGASSVSEEDAEGLVAKIYLAQGSRVMLTRNLWTNKGL
jgi:ATP-dependent DNA helicase PIF1